MADTQVSNRTYLGGAIILSFGAIIAALITSGQLRLQFGSQEPTPTATVLPPTPTMTAAAPTMTAPAATTVTSTAPRYGSDEEKCQQLLNSFPQTEEEMRARFNLPPDSSVALVTEFCRGEVVNGFILEGRTDIQVEVPDGGCIDSDTDSYFSETPQPESWGGLRATGGVVRAEGMTYRAAWCERIP